MPGIFTSAIAERRHEEARIARASGTPLPLPELLLPYEVSPFGLLIRCPGSCQRSASVTADGWNRGVIGMHTAMYGGVCTASGRPADVQSAWDRDEGLNPEEAAVQMAVYRSLVACKGYDTSTGEECHHPACHAKRAKKAARS